MAEALSAEISIATQEAYQNLGAFLNAIQNASNSLNTLGAAVKKAEDDAQAMAKAYADAEMQFKATGTESDKLKMEEMRKATQNAGERVTNLRREFGSLENELKDVAKAESNVSTETLKTAKSLETTTARTADQAKAATNLKTSTESGSAALSGMTAALTGIATGLVTSILSMQSLDKVLVAIAEHTQNVVAARVQLGEAKSSFEERIQPIIWNLGVLPGQQGQARARNLVTDIQKRAPGVQADVAAELLAKAQVTGYKIADADKPELDTKAPDLAIVAEAAKFAFRQHFDPDTAGKLFNLAKIGDPSIGGTVRTQKQMKQMLAQMESSFNQISVTNPQQLMQSVINASAGPMSQGVTMRESFANYAGAAALQPNPLEAATNVDQLVRVAVGEDPAMRLTLARIAQKRGALSQGAIDASAKQVAPTIKSEHSEAIAAARETIEKEKRSIQLREEERQLAAADLAEQARRFSFEMTELAKEEVDPKKRKQIPEIQEKERRAKEEFAKRQAEAAVRLQRSKQSDVDAETGIATSSARIIKLQSEDAQKLKDAALLDAFSRQSLSTKLDFLWKVTDKMSPTDLGAFTNQVAQGRIAQDLVKILGPAGHAARQTALNATGDTKLLDKRNQAFRQNSTSQAGETKVAGEQGGLSATEAGQQFYNGIADLATKDIRNITAKGEGATGWGVDTGIITGLFDIQTNAGDPNVLTARRIALIARDRWAKFLATTRPETKKKFASKIKAFNGKFSLLLNELFTPGMLLSRIRQTTEIVSEMGALIIEMQNDDLGSGFAPGINGPNEVDLPSNQPNFGALDPNGLLNSKYSDPSDAFDDNSIGRRALPDSQGPPNPASGPRSSSVGFDPSGGSDDVLRAAQAGGVASGATYNISVGTLVSQGADSFDLPARLGVPDIG